jgi:uncharacterized protein (TIGR03382 family)
MGRLCMGAALSALAGCGSCEIDVGPVPNGFDPAARIERAAQARITTSGLGLVSSLATRWVQDAARVPCQADVDCPSTLGSTCAGTRCTGSLASFGGVHVAIDGVTVASLPPADLSASIALRLAGSLPIRDEATSSDCIATLSGPTAADLALALEPSVGYATFQVASASLGIGAANLSLAPDPAGSGAAICDASGVAILMPLVRAELESALRPAMTDLLGRAIGEACDVSSTCPDGTACTMSGYCADGDRIIPLPLGFDQRIGIPPVLESYGTPDAMADLSIQVGGTIDADPSGVTAGILGGMELASPNPRCATIQQSPRLRPGFSAPALLPPSDAFDSDFDGTDDQPYQIGFGLSKALIDQAVWSAYGGGLLCGAISTNDYEEIHTGTLGIIIPSIRYLTKSHLFARSERPARVSAWLRTEPVVQIGSGEVRQEAGGDLVFEDPLIHVYLYDLEINLSALIEERWVRVMTATIDLHLGVGLMVTPDDQLEPIVGVGVPEIVSNIRITNNELLSETEASLQQALPTLLSFALLELAGSAGQFPIPTLEGTDLDVLGIRGVGGPAFDTLAVFADVALTTGNLTARAETVASLGAVRIPETAAFAVDHAGGPTYPAIEIVLGGSGPAGQTLEHQVRVDGGFWTPFTGRERITVERPELLIQGRHRIEVRSRIAGDAESLDPTPEVLEVLIDSEAPILDVDRHGDGYQVSVFDRVSRARVTADAITESGMEPIGLDGEGRGTIGPETLAVRARDEIGLESEVVLRAAPAVAGPPASSGCASGGAPGFGALLASVAYVLRRRRSR